MRRIDADELIVRLQAAYVCKAGIGGDSETAEGILIAIQAVVDAPTVSDEELRREAEWNYDKGFKEGYATAIDIVRETMADLIEEKNDEE